MRALSGTSGGTAGGGDEPLPAPLWPLALWLRGIPDALHEAALAGALDRVVGGDRLHALEGRRITIAVTDTGNRLRFRVRGGCLRRDPAAGAPEGAREVTVRGRLLDFIRLAARTADPDTLFFARRLCLEGDTETGLHIKNLLDALDFDWRTTLRGVLGKSAGERATAWAERSGLEVRVRGLVERILR